MELGIVACSEGSAMSTTDNVSTEQEQARWCQSLSNGQPLGRPLFQNSFFDTRRLLECDKVGVAPRRRRGCDC